MLFAGSHSVLDLFVFFLCFQAEDPPLHTPMVINDMPHMAQFVFDLYNQKIDSLMRMRNLPSVWFFYSQLPLHACVIVDLIHLR